MIVDAHCHLEERMLTVQQLLQQMDRFGIGRIALIASTSDPFPWSKTADAATELLRAALMGPLRGLGLQFYRGTVTRDGNFSLLGTRYRIYGLPDNGTVARVLQAHPDRFYGWVFVNPSAADPLPELEKWIGQPGWIGVKSHPFWHRYAVAELDRVAAFCLDAKRPLLIHLGGDRASGDYRYLPERYPKLKILYAHAGAPFYQELWGYIKDNPNTFIDFSFPGYIDERIRREALAVLGADRCLFGTDAPYGWADHGNMVDAICRLPLSNPEREAILGGNFQSLIAS